MHLNLAAGEKKTFLLPIYSSLKLTSEHLLKSGLTLIRVRFRDFRLLLALEALNADFRVQRLNRDPISSVAVDRPFSLISGVSKIAISSIGKTETWATLSSFR